MEIIEVRPAYGRKYASFAEVLRDWLDCKDFQIVGTSAYLNKADVEKYGNGTVVTQIFIGNKMMIIA